MRYYAHNSSLHHDMELYVFTHYRSNPKTFNPYKLNISNWIASMKDLGAKHGVLTAKHGCGFLLWPTNTTLPGGSPYYYDISNTIHKRNIVAEFSNEMGRAGLGHGFYYSLARNFYLNVNKHYVNGSKSLLPGQQNVTQAQFESIAIGHLKELWSTFGNLTEIWFDGGYKSDMKENLTNLLSELQPNSVGWNGVGISKSPILWVGTESGHPKGDGIWSTGCKYGNGDPNSSLFCPKGVDTTLQTDDKWFFGKDYPVRTLEDLVDVYHESVGHNGVLELDFAINEKGLVEPAHADMYRNFGNWIKKCYRKPVSQGVIGHGEEQGLLKIPHNTPIDRLMLQEDISDGQKVREFIIYRKGFNGRTWIFLYQNNAGIGNKKIVIFNETIQTDELKIIITKSMGSDSGEIKVSAFHPHNCKLPTNAIPKPTRPQLRQQSHEIVALIHFNMATFSRDGDPGCGIDNWNIKADYASGPT